MALSPYDVELRNQYFFEGVKKEQGQEADQVTDDIVAAIIGVLAAMGITTFVGMTKAKFAQILTKITAQVSKTVSGSFASVVSRAKQVLAAVQKVGLSNAFKITGRLTMPKGSWPIADNPATRLKMWKDLTDDFIPTTGLKPLDLIRDFGRGAVKMASQAITTAYARKDPITSLIESVRGTPEKKFKDGMANKLANNYRAGIDTLFQYIKNWVNQKVGSFFYDRYQWVSTIDDRTTDYCIDHHLRIYRYDFGPVPPAHYRCRSTIVGIDDATEPGSNAPPPANFDDWFENQPTDFLNEILTTADKDALKNGQGFDPQAYKNLRTLTIAEYVKRLPLMQLDEE